MKNELVTKLQKILGMILLGAAGFLAWAQIDGLTNETRPVRAESETRELAHVILDFRHDTGTWPRNADGTIDLTRLLGTRSGPAPTMQAGAPGNRLPGMPFSETHTGGRALETAWLRQIPLDPWGSSYRVVITDEAVAVFSIGPNRIQDTDPTRLWTRPDNINPCDGDDVGFVLEFEKEGASR